MSGVLFLSHWEWEQSLLASSSPCLGRTALLLEDSEHSDLAEAEEEELAEEELDEESDEASDDDCSEVVDGTSQLGLGCAVVSCGRDGCKLSAVLADC